MSELDANIQMYIKWFVAIFACIVTFKWISPRWCSRMYDSLYACVINKACTQLNWLLKKQKEKVIGEELQDLQKQIGNRAMKILEIGAGSGLNFKYYPTGSVVVCVEPKCAAFNNYLRNNASQHDLEVIGPVMCYAEDMSVSVPDSSVDAVVSTHVLCSVKDIDACMQEVKRVLRKNGKFVYVEHVRAAAGSWTLLLQRMIEPVWLIISDKCSCLTDPDQVIQQAGFSHVNTQQFTLSKGLRVIRPHIYGVATR